MDCPLRLQLILLLAFASVCVTPGHCAERVIMVLVEGLVGSPALHQKQNWKFDPKEAARLNPDFERENGHKSVILIEKLGLGIDGNQLQRKAQQQLRDSIPIPD